MAEQLNGLKTINNLQRDGSLQNLLLAVKESKLSLDAFSKKLAEQKKMALIKQKEAEILKKKEEERASQEAVKVAEEPKKEEIKKEFKPAENRNFRKFDGKEQKNNNFQKDGKKPPFNRTQNGQNQNKKFVSTKANNFKSFAPTESSAVLSQPERNFGNKNKRRNVEENKKQNVNKKQAERYAGKDNNIYVLDDENGYEETIMGSRKLVRKKKEVQTVVAPKITHAVLTSREITIKDLSEKIGKPVAEIVKKCMLLGVMATINSTIDFDTCELVCSDFGIRPMAAESSDRMLSFAWSTTSCNRTSAETPRAFAIRTKVSSFGVLTPRSITLMWVGLMSTSSASCSWVKFARSLAVLILFPMAAWSMVPLL